MISMVLAVLKIFSPRLYLVKTSRDKIFAIGDGMNDIEMLKESGVSVAMGNSVQEVFKVSKYSTKKYIENGTQEVLDWILKGISP